MNKKKYVITFIFIFILVFIFFLIPYKYIVISVVNSNLDIGDFKLLSEEASLKDIINQGFIQDGGFGCKSYKNEKDQIRIEFSGFPDVLDSYVLTGIKTTNPAYSVYDIQVGEDINKAINTLKSKGFKKIENIKYSYIKNRVMIRLYANDNLNIAEIGIYLQSTNLSKVQF